MSKKKKRANESKLRSKEEVVTSYMNIYQGFNFEKMNVKDFSHDKPKDLKSNYQNVKKFNWSLMDYIWVCNFSRPEFGFSFCLEFDMFDESKLEFGNFISEPFRREITDSFSDIIGQLESGKLERGQIPYRIEDFIELLTKVEKKLCLDKFGKDHEKFANVADFETEDFQNIIIENDPNYCGKDFSARENMDQVDNLLVKKLAQYFELAGEAQSVSQTVDLQSEIQKLESSDESEDSEESL